MYTYWTNRKQLSALIITFLLSMDAMAAQGFQMNLATPVVVELVKDQTVYNDAPVNNAVEPVKEKIRNQINNNIQKARDLAQSSPILANQIIQSEEYRDHKCEAPQIMFNLIDRLNVNCKLDVIKETCRNSQARVKDVIGRSDPDMNYTNDLASIKKMIAMEHRLMGKLNNISTANKQCSRGFRFAVTNQACLSTYQNYFDELAIQVKDTCTPLAVENEINGFVEEMRGDYSSIGDLPSVIKGHLESRKTEINLALTIKELNRARIELEKALGHEGASPSRLPSNSKKSGPQ